MIEVKKIKDLGNFYDPYSDLEYLAHTIILCALTPKVSSLKNARLTPVIEKQIQNIETLGAEVNLVKGQYLIQGIGLKKKKFDELQLDLTDHLYVDVLLLTLFASQEYNYLYINGSKSAIANVKPYIKNILHVEFHFDNESSIQLKPKEFVYDKTINIEPHHYLDKNQFLLNSLLEKYPLKITERTPLRDHFPNLLKFMKANIAFQKTGLQQKYTDELARRLARLNPLKVEKKIITVLQHTPAINERKFDILNDPFYTAIWVLITMLNPGDDKLFDSISVNPLRSGIFAAFKRLGAKLDILGKKERNGESIGRIRIKYSKDMTGRKFGGDFIHSIENEIPLLAVAACFAQGETIIRNIPNLNRKNRVLNNQLCYNLRLAGVDVGEIDDGFVIRGRGETDSAEFDAFHNPYLGFALYVLASKSQGKSTIINAECMKDLYPDTFIQLTTETPVEKNKESEEEEVVHEN